MIEPTPNLAWCERVLEGYYNPTPEKGGPGTPGPVEKVELTVTVTDANGTRWTYDVPHLEINRGQGHVAVAEEFYDPPPDIRSDLSDLAIPSMGPAYLRMLLVGRIVPREDGITYTLTRHTPGDP
jgi:hypothetical protein